MGLNFTHLEECDGCGALLPLREIIYVDDRFLCLYGCGVSRSIRNDRPVLSDEALSRLSAVIQRRYRFPWKKSPLKTIIVAALLALSPALGFFSTLHAQISYVTRPTVTGGIPGNYFQMPQPAAGTGVVAVSVVHPYVPPEKSEVLRKTIEFQKKQAAGGSAISQYDLGIRYLTGDGLQQSRELALKWLRLSASQGNTQAQQKLKLVEKP